MSSPYHVGDEVQLTATVTDLTDALVDPSTVTFQVRTGDGGFLSPVIPTRVSLGVYTYLQPATGSGNWYWRVVCTGAAVAANEAAFFVLPTDFPT